MKFLVIIFSLAYATFSFGYTKSFTEDQLQRSLDAIMPIEKTQLLVTLRLSEPDIDLIKDTDELGIRTNISVRAPGGLKGQGRVRMTGSIDYDASTGSFFIVKPKVTELTVDNLAKKYQKGVKQLVQSALSHAMVKYPVYQLRDDDMQQRMAKAVIKSVSVEGQRLNVEIGF